MSDGEHITLRQYFDTRCDGQMRQHEIHFQRIEEHLAYLGDSTRAKFQSIEGLTEALAQDMERRLAGMDRDLEHRFPTRTDFDSMKKDQEAAVRSIRDEFREILKGAAEDLRELRDFRMSLNGKATQTAANVAIGLALLACTASVINTIVMFIKR